MSRVSIVGGTDENENDNDDELIKRNQRTRIARISSRMLEFSFAYLLVDAIQTLEERKKDSSMLSARKPQQNRLLRLWSRVFHPICIYLIARSLMTFILRFIINSLSSNKRSSSSTQSNLVQKLRWLLEVNGDPACSVDKLTPVAYLAHPIFITMFCIALPYYLRNVRPFDCSVVRFLLDPKREIHRLSGSTRKKLNSALQRVEQQRRELSSLLGTRNKFRAPHLQRMNLYDGAQLQATLVRLMAQSNTLRHFRQNLETIRPATFNADRLQFYHRMFAILYISAIIINILIFCSLITFTVLINWQERCNEQFTVQHRRPNNSRPSDCPFLPQFRPVEYRMFVEICTSHAMFVLISFSLVVSLIGLIAGNQLVMTNCVSASLSRLSADLRQLGRRLEQVQVGQGKQIKRNAPELASMESAMYVNIIHLWTYETESQRNVAQLGILMTFYISLVGSLTLASLGAYLPSVSASSVGCTASGPNSERQQNFVDEHIGLIATIIPAMLWTFANALMLTCAVITSRVVRMKRLVVSILAQTVEIQHIQRSIVAEQSSSLELDDGRREMEANDPLLLLWRKIVISPSFIEDHHSVNILHSKITYGKVLELNFYVIALISLLSSRR